MEYVLYITCYKFVYKIYKYACNLWSGNKILSYINERIHRQGKVFYIYILVLSGYMKIYIEWYLLYLKKHIYMHTYILLSHLAQIFYLVGELITRNSLPDLLKWLEALTIAYKENVILSQ